MQQLQQTNAIHELDHHSRSREKEKNGQLFLYKKRIRQVKKREREKTNQTKNNAAPGKSASWVIYISVSTCVSV
jgi:hypothetical protein